MRWPGAPGRRRRGQEPTDRTLPFRPEACLCQSATTLTSVRPASTKRRWPRQAPRRQGADDHPFHHTVAGVDAPVHEGQERAQFEEEPHCRVQRNPGRHQSLRQRIPHPCELTLWPDVFLTEWNRPQELRGVALPPEGDGEQTKTSRSSTGQTVPALQLVEGAMPPTVVCRKSRLGEQSGAHLRGALVPAAAT